MSSIARKFMSVFLTFIMVISSFPAIIQAENEPVLSVDDATVTQPGDVATMSLRLSDLPEEIYMLQLTIEYDADALTLMNVDTGEVFSNVGSPTINDTVRGKIYLNWDSAVSSISDDCALLTMHFTVLTDETVENAVRVSSNEDCILANWRNEFVPILDAGTIYVGGGYNYAVLDDEGNLVFFRSSSRYDVSDEPQTVSDINGKNYTGFVWPINETLANGRPLWYEKRDQIMKAYVSVNQIICPGSLAYWFDGCSALNSFNTAGICLDDVDDMTCLFEGCVSLTQVDLGPEWNKWTDQSYLPQGNWVSSVSDIVKTETELYGQYPLNATEWAGTWHRDTSYLFCGFLWEEAENGYSADISYEGNNSSHIYTLDIMVNVSQEQAKCEEDGLITYTVSVDAQDSLDGASHSDVKTTILPAFGHEYVVNYIWGEGNASVTAEAVCQHDDSHVVSETVTASSFQTTDPSCTGSGMIVYTAEFSNELFETQIKEVTIPSLGHNFVFDSWGWSDDYSSASASFICSRDSSHTEIVDAQISQTTVQPTCEEAGEATYTATVVFEGNTYIDTQMVDLNALGHSYGEPVYSWTDDHSSVTGVVVCQNDNDHTVSETVSTDMVRIEPTCEKEGKIHYNAIFTNPLFTTQTQEIVIDALGHSYVFNGWEWTGSEEEGYTAATAVFVCENNSAHILNVAAELSMEIINEGDDDEYMSYSAVANYEGEEYTDARTSNVPSEMSYGKAYAVLTDEGEFIFFRSKNSYTDNVYTTAVDIDGNEYSGTVFADIETRVAGYPEAIPWHKEQSIRRSIVSVRIADGQTIRPRSLAYWFFDCINLTQIDLAGLDTSRVTSMYRTFSDCYQLASLDVTGFDTSSVASMSHMFYQCLVLTSLDVSGFDTSNVYDMSDMFDRCYVLSSLDLSNFDTSKVTNMSGMFFGCNALTSLDVTGFDTSNVTNMSNMFHLCSGLTSLDVTGFDTSKVVNMSDMFSACSSLNTVDLSNFDTSKVKDMSCMFNYCSSLENLDVSNFDTSKVIDMSSMFANTAFTSLDVSNFNTSNVIAMNNMFYNTALTSLDVSNFDTSNVVGMGNMFNRCNYLTSLDVSNFDTSKAVYMGGLFYSCSSLESIDVSNFDTSNVVDMSGMFGYCLSLESIDVCNFDTSKVRNMSSMFSNNNALTSLDLSNFDTSSVTDMNNMFHGCIALTTIDLSNFNTSNVTNMTYMFRACQALTSLNIKNFDTSNVTGMSGMFGDCTSLASLDLSNFNTAKVTDMGNMFDHCLSLSTLDIRSFDNRNVTRMTYMFAYCSSLVGIKLGEGWKKWMNDAYLPEGTWINKTTGMTKTETELYNDYPLNAEEWAGEWYLDSAYVYQGFIWEEDNNGYKAYAGYLGDNSSYLYKVEGSVSISESVEPTCEENGIIIYHAMVSANDSIDGVEHEENKEVILNALGHIWSDPVWTWAEDSASAQAYFVCERNENHSALIDAVISEIVIKQPDYYEDGSKECTAIVLLDGTEYSDVRNVVLPALKEMFGEIVYEDVIDMGFVSEDDIPEDLWYSPCALSDEIYTGKAIKKTFRVYDYKTLLKEGKDYIVKYSNNTKVSTAEKKATILITGKGNYKNKDTVTFNILPKSIEDDDLVISGINAVKFNGKIQKLKPTIKYNGKTLKTGTDYVLEYNDSFDDKTAYKDVGTYSIVARAKEGGNFAGIRILEYAIVPKTQTLISKVTLTKPKDIMYSGDPIDQESFDIILKDKNNKERQNGILIKGTDYELSLSEDTVSIGTVNVTIMGLGFYSGTRNTSFQIKGIPISKTKVVSNYFVPSFVYDGTRKTQDHLVITYQEDKYSEVVVLDPETDYDISYSNNINVGSAAVILTGKGLYTGTSKIAFKITAYDITADTDHKISLTYSGSAIHSKAGARPDMQVNFDGIMLEEGSDYTLSFKNNTAVNDGSNPKKIPSFTIKGKGNFKGTMTDNQFSIVQRSLTDGVVMTATDKAFSMKKNGWKATPVLKDNGKKLVSGTDYEKSVAYTYLNDTIINNGTVQRFKDETVQANDIIPVGTCIKVTAKGIKNYVDEIFCIYRITKADISKAKVTIRPKEYTGKPVTLTKDDIVVKLNKKVVDPSNYEIDISSYKNNINKGKASVRLLGVNDLGSSKTVNFTIGAKILQWWVNLWQ